MIRQAHGFINVSQCKLDASHALFGLGDLLGGFLPVIALLLTHYRFDKERLLVVNERSCPVPQSLLGHRGEIVVDARHGQAVTGNGPGQEQFLCVVLERLGVFLQVYREASTGVIQAVRDIDRSGLLAVQVEDLLKGVQTGLVVSLAAEDFGLNGEQLWVEGVCFVDELGSLLNVRQGPIEMVGRTKGQGFLKVERGSEGV